MNALIQSREGYLYLLYDAKAEICKIGCTKGDMQKRQRGIMAANGNVLINILNAKVEDRFASESQCHQRFKSDRLNGEWFSANIVEIINYICDEIDWCEMDCENLARVAQCIVGASVGNDAMVKKALYRASA